MRHKLSQVAVIIFFGIFLIGCNGTAPTPIITPLSKNYTSIDAYEKKVLLEKSMHNVHKYYNYNLGRRYFKHSRHSKVRDSSIFFETHHNDSVFPFSIHYIYQFKYDVDSNKILMIDKSYCAPVADYKDRDPYFIREPDNLTKYINMYQVKLEKEYEATLTKYEKHKKEFIKRKPESLKTYKSIHITTEDINHIIPKKIIDKLSEYKLWATNQESVLQSYLNGTGSSFKIGSRVLKAQAGRYKVDYEKYDYMYEYDKFPINLVYKINKVYYNFLPSLFTLKDKNIDVEVLNNTEYADGKSINSFKITNKTKEPIQIETISGYYAGAVIDNIMYAETVMLPPMSFKIVDGIKDFPSKKSIQVKDKNKKVNYGFSIAYKMINLDKVKNVYKVDTYTISE